jgi:hypothetical protein
MPDALWAAGVLTAIAATAAAVVVAVGGRAQMRGALGFGFAGVPDSVGELAAILANNALMMSAIVVTCVLVQLPHWLADPAEPVSVSRDARVIGDVLIGSTALCNAALLGVSIGAYGSRMVGAVLPHGPVEIGAYCLVLGLYLRARRGRVEPRAGARTVLLAFALLIAAGTLETYAA